MWLYVTKEGLTPLHLAVEKSNIDMVRILLKKGANLQADAMI